MYEYDIFISYKRGREPERWIERHFQPLLEHYVGLELGRPPAIFRDDRLEAGNTWPAELGIALGVSRVMVPLWTRTYFHSEWCSRELAEMLGREEETGRRSATQPIGLVIPAVLHDCEDLPPQLQPIQATPLRDCFNPRMREESRLAEQLADRLAQMAPGIRSSIEAAPDFRADWPVAAAQRFLAAVRRSDAPSQTDLPGFAA